LRDAYLYYTGSYTVKDNTFKGEVLVQRHTSPRGDDNPLFGGRGGRHRRQRHLHRYARGHEGTALVGKASQIFGATLHKLAEAD